MQELPEQQQINFVDIPVEEMISFITTFSVGLIGVAFFLGFVIKKVLQFFKAF